MTEFLRPQEHLRRFGPKPSDSEEDCPGCGAKILKGQYSTLITIGPGDDPEEQRKSASGKAFTAIAVEVHWSCATGHEK